MQIYKTGLLFLLALISACTQTDQHQSLITVDTHIDIPVQLGTDTADPGIDGPMQVDLPKMRSGGLDVGFFIVYVAQDSVTPEGYATAYLQAEEKFAAIERMLNSYPDQIALARNPEEVQRILDQGKLVAAIGVENAFPLGPNLEHLDEFYARGARYISLTHFGHNDFASSSSSKAGDDSSYHEPQPEGLSNSGKVLIDKMNGLGIMVDVSHTSRETTLQAASYSKAPVIASHSGVMALYEHPRNLSDEEIIAIAAGGGVIQLVAFDTYMREVNSENRAAINQIREELGMTAPDAYKYATQETLGEQRRRVAELDAKWSRANVSTLVDHIDYVVNLVGIDHAGIASDFGGGGGVQGWDNAAETRAVTDELRRRGYSIEEIQKIWAGNLLRVWSRVEEVAQSF